MPRADQLHGTKITFDFPSVGATENILTAAVFAKGTTVIDNAAREPEIGDLCNFLVAMGADIEGIGSSTLVIHGVERDSLHPVTHEVVPDRIQAATYIAAAAVTGGAITLVNARAEHMEMLLRRFVDMGMTVTPQTKGIAVWAPERLRSIDVATLPYPGIATDYKPLIVTMLSVADGVGIVTENLYPGRFRYVEELLRLGADISTDGHHAVVRGVPRLSRRSGARPGHSRGCSAGGCRVGCRWRDGDQRREPRGPWLRRPRGATCRPRCRHQSSLTGWSDGLRSGWLRSGWSRLTARRLASHNRPTMTSNGPATMSPSSHPP